MVTGCIGLAALSHSSGGWKSEIKGSAELVCFEGSPVSLQTAIFSHCLHNFFSLLCWCPNRHFLQGSQFVKTLNGVRAGSMNRLS